MKKDNTAQAEIDAEKTFAVVGVRAVISKQTERITATMRNKIATYDKIVAAHAKALIQDEIKCTWPVPPNYDPILDDLSSPFNETQLHDMINRLPTDIQSHFQTMAQKAFSYLFAALPKNAIASYAGSTNLPIDDISWFKFCNVLRVLEDPLQVFELISAAALTKSQATAIKTIYPSIALMTEVAIQSAVTNARAKSPKGDPYELPYKAEQGLKTFLGMPITVPAYQDTFVKPDQTKDQQQQPSRAQLDPGAEMSLTSAQQIQFPKA